MRPRRQPCLLILLCAVAGIIAAEFFPAPAAPALVAAGALALFLHTRSARGFWRPEPPAALMLAALFFGLHQAGWHQAPARRIAEALAAANAARDFEVVVTGDPAPAGKGRWGFDCRALSVDGAPVSFPARAVARGDAPMPGDRLRLRASAFRPEPPLNPGQLDYAGYLARRGIFVELHARHLDDMALLERGGLPQPARWLRAARERLAGALTRDLEFDPVVSAVIPGVVLGATGDMPPGLIEGFQAAGALHVFSVSGLHVGMAGLLAWIALGALSPGPRARTALALGAVWLYALVTGGNTPALRAAVMATAVAGGALFSREPSLVNSISAAGALLLASDTNALFQAGFQLSFSAVLALALLAERFAAPLRRLLSPDPLIPRALVPRWRRLVSAGAIRGAELLTVSLAAGLGTSLFSAWHFSLMTPGGVITNVLAVPLAFCVLSIGLLSAALSFVAPWLSLLANNANWLVTTCLVQTALFFGSQPWASVPGHPAGWRKPPAELWVLALEEGGSAVLRAGGQTWLIGAGSKEDYRRVVRPFLRWYGTGRLDGLILPQGDAGYYGGAEQCVAELRPRRIVQAAVHDRSPTRARLNAVLAAAGIAREEIAAGGRIGLPGGVRVEALYPPAGLRARIAGERALALKITARSVSALVCAEPPFATQSRLADLGRETLRADICVIGRSRSDPVPDPRFIDTVGAPLWIWAGGVLPSEAALLPPGAVTLRETGAVRVRLHPGPAEAEGFRAGAL